MKKIAWVMTLFFAAVLTASIVAGVPSGPNSLTVLNSGRYGSASAQTVSAIAGNVSELNVNANAITQTWQGYFGNITGTIVLGDANNNTLYDWSLSSPRGEIYATRTSSTPTWTSIRCANTTNIASEDTSLGVNEATDADSVNNTFFNTTSFSQFYVGTVNINTSQNCFAARMYNSTGQSSTTNFAEILLHDSSNLVYTTILDQDALGFDGRTHDFEMMVGENGHSGDTSTTTYYFYVELG
jgi:hypothetical protein